MEYVLVTGASTGIGYAIAQLLIDKGYFVFGSVRKEEDADRLKQDFGSKQFEALLFDVRDSAAIQQAVTIVEAELNGQSLSGLINNAGIGVIGPLAHIPMEDIRLQFDVNVIGLLDVTKAFLPLLGARMPVLEKPGKIINVSSVAGINTTPIAGLYSASKFAVESISDALRRELFLYGIDVIVLQPGPIKTPIWDKTRAVQDAYLDTDYGPILKGLSLRLEESAAKAMDPMAVAQRAYQALQLKRPKTRYIIAKNAWMLKLMSKFVPDRVVDRIIFRTLKKFTTKAQ